jgi:CubicO group peptidase (beta-lactamase class C family)
MRLSVASAIVALVATAIPPQRTAQNLDAAIDAIATDALKQPLAGLSIAVARRAQPVFARGYGRANLDRNVPVTADTVFHIDSVSKYVEAAAALSLVEAGKLALDEDVRKYVPNAPTHGRRVTIQQLLSHTSGLYNFTSLPDADAHETRDWTHEQAFALFRDKPFDFAPGTRWRYSNSGFYLAGVAIERVAGVPYARYIKEAVFAPAGVTTASLCTVHDIVDNLANGYDVVKGSLLPGPQMTWSLPFAAGAVCATASDLVHWQNAVDSSRVISTDSLRRMRTPTRLSDGVEIDYGFGTRIGSFEGHRVFGHTGSGGGFTSILQSFPDDGVTIAVLSNTDGARVANVSAQIASTIFGIEHHDPQDLSVPAAEAQAVTGTFDSDEGPVETLPCGDKMCFRIPGSGVQSGVKRQAPFVYALDANTTVRFHQRAARADWAFVYRAGFLSDAKYRR